MKTFFVILIAFSALPTVQAAESTAGPYAGIDLGRSTFNLKPAGQSGSIKLGDSTSVKLFGGLRLNQNLGVEAGVVRIGSFKPSAAVGSAPAMQGGRATSLYGAVTGRLALTDALGLTARAGIARNRVSGGDASPATQSTNGRKTAAIFGVGVDYFVSKDLALTANYDYHGKLSDRLSANSLGVGARLSF